jgi:hypothetical protein
MAICSKIHGCIAALLSAALVLFGLLCSLWEGYYQIQ